MGGKVTYQIVADDDKAKRQVEKFFYNMERNSQRAADGVDDMNKKWSKMGRNIMSIAAGGGALAVFQKSLQAIKQEFEDLQRKRQEAMQTQLTAAQARARAMENAPDISEERMENLAGGVRNVGGMTEKKTWNLLSNLVSASGDASMKQIREAAMTAAKFAGRTGEDPTTRGGAILDWLNASGAQSGQAAMGALLQYKSQSRVASSEKLFSSIGRIAGMTNIQGVDEEMAREIGAYFSQTMKDVTGEKSGTAAINFANRIMALSPEKDTPFFERLKGVQQRYGKMSETERAEFRQELGGEAEARGPIAALLRGDESAMQLMESIRGKITPTGESTARAAENLSEKMTDQMVQLQNKVTTSIDQIQTGNVQGARWAAAKSALQDVQKATEEIGFFERKFNLAEYDLETMTGRKKALQSAQSIFSRYQDRFGKKKVEAGETAAGTFMDAIFGGLPGEHPAKQRMVENPNYNPELAKRMQEMTQALQNMQNNLEENRKAQEENTEAQRENAEAQRQNAADQTEANPESEPAGI